MDVILDASVVNCRIMTIAGSWRSWWHKKWCWNFQNEIPNRLYLHQNQQDSLEPTDAPVDSNGVRDPNGTTSGPRRSTTLFLKVMLEFNMQQHIDASAGTLSKLHVITKSFLNQNAEYSGTLLNRRLLAVTSASMPSKLLRGYSETLGGAINNWKEWYSKIA